MISLYRWQAGQSHGNWVELPDLPKDGCHIPDGEVWWLDLDDPSEEEEDLVFKSFLPVHPLSLEDIRRPKREGESQPHLPKVEQFTDYLFAIANPIRPVTPGSGPDRTDQPCELSQLSAILTERVLITHHYQLLPSVTDAKQFLHRHAGEGGRGPDYLFHLVLDRIVDEFAPQVDHIQDRLDEIEMEVFATASQELILELIRTKRRVISLRKTLILMREMLARLTRGEFDLVDAREIAYYRNVYDHLVRYTELIDGAREMVSDLMQTHLAATSNKLNAIMKMLAMVSTIILPMSLIASIYGMNFENLPEKEWKYGYPFSLGLMAFVAVIAVWIFRRKKWL
jgi:magnesium transporter